MTKADQRRRSAAADRQALQEAAQEEAAERARGEHQPARRPEPIRARRSGSRRSQRRKRQRAAFNGMANGVPDMLTVDLLTKPRVRVLARRVAPAGRSSRPSSTLQQSEYVDPASKVEPGHVIDPEILIRGRDRGPPGHAEAARARRLARGRQDRSVRLSGDVSSVTLAERLLRQRGAARPARHARPDLRADQGLRPGARAAAAPAPPPPSPPVPAAASTAYTGHVLG